ncbi:DUF4625 domain-containing protein [Aquimarina longa]|uniref:DUF4625 domain-containing protein n=1 Tax=Aquimarina longa TaxID=1080221 RepID=UPI000783AC0F|nr:DUF4625 domain-containing protein [Aquimarina longa]
MFRNNKIIAIFIFSAFILIGCSKDDEDQKDLDKPTITVAYKDGFPKSCTTLKKGQEHIISVKVSDNLELASYGIDVHNNFDHHTHDDQGTKCDLNPVKSPKNPFVYLENKPIQGKVKQFEIKHILKIPADIDTGDYHCQISVVDITGWQSRTSIDIKIVD